MEMQKAKVEIDADLQDLIPQFLENRKKDIESLKALVQQNDLEAIGQLAHKMKGAAAGYGFVQLSEYAAQIESAARAKISDPIPQLLDKMKAHFENIEVRFVSM